MNASTRNRWTARLLGVTVAAATSASCALVYDYSDYRNRPSTAGSGGGATSASGTGGDATATGSGVGGMMDAGPFDPACVFSQCSTCELKFASAGTKIPGGDAGDCNELVCDGAGHVITVPDDDPPPPPSDCMEVVCAGGVHVPTPRANGTPCDGTKFCFDGTCSECGLSSQCAPPGECQLAGCVQGTCKYSSTCGVDSDCCGGVCKLKPCAM